MEQSLENVLIFEPVHNSTFKIHLLLCRCLALAQTQSKSTNQLALSLYLWFIVFSLDEPTACWFRAIALSKTSYLMLHFNGHDLCNAIAPKSARFRIWTNLF